jgi:4-hydroxybenzoate polyprenyltransferase
VAILYLIAIGFWAAAFWQIRPQWLGLAALLPMAIHFAWQVAALDRTNAADALAKFRSNRFAGLLMFMACFVIGATA